MGLSPYRSERFWLSSPKKMCDKMVGCGAASAIGVDSRRFGITRVT